MNFRAEVVVFILAAFVMLSTVDGVPRRYKSFYDLARTGCKLPGELCNKDKDCCSETCMRIKGIKFCVP